MYPEPCESSWHLLNTVSITPSQQSSITIKTDIFYAQLLVSSLRNRSPPTDAPGTTFLLGVPLCQHWSEKIQQWPAVTGFTNPVEHIFFPCYSWDLQLAHHAREEISSILCGTTFSLSKTHDCVYQRVHYFNTVQTVQFRCNFTALLFPALATTVPTSRCSTQTLGLCSACATSTRHKNRLLCRVSGHVDPPDNGDHDPVDQEAALQRKLWSPTDCFILLARQMEEQQVASGKTVLASEVIALRLTRLTQLHVELTSDCPGGSFPSPFSRHPGRWSPGHCKKSCPSLPMFIYTFLL